MKTSLSHEAGERSVQFHQVGHMACCTIKTQIDEKTSGKGWFPHHERVRLLHHRRKEHLVPCYLKNLYAFSPMNNSLQNGVKFLKPSKLFEYDAGIS